MIITFCGHSDYNMCSKDEKSLLKLLESIIQKRDVEFYLGGYGNFDSFAYNCAKKYKAKCKNAKLVFITPYIDGWLDKRKEVIQNLYDEILYPELENTPKKFAILKRNEWMIQKADHVIGYVKTHYGGAYRTLLYAKKNNKPYTNLYKGKYELY